MLTLNFKDQPRLVKVKWDDTSNIQGWHSREEIESHFEQNPFRCENIGYLIATDGTDAIYIASRKGMFNDRDDAWGLIERIPKGVITQIIYLNEPNVERWEWDGTKETLMALQDDCLISIEDGHCPDISKILSLPPWRAVMIARIAVKVGVLEEYRLDKLSSAARDVGGDGKLPEDLFTKED